MGSTRGGRGIQCVVIAGGWEYFTFMTRPQEWCRHMHIVNYTITTKRFSGHGITILYHYTCVLLVGSDTLATFCIDVYAISFWYYQFSLSCIHARASIVSLQCASETSMKANVVDCGELQNELWKLSDITELFARVPIPYDVFIDMPKLNDVLPATHSAVESLKVCYVCPRLKIAHLQVVWRVVLDVLQQSRRSLSAAQKHSVIVNTTIKSTNWAGVCGATGLSARSKHAQLLMSILYVFYLPSKRSWLCQFMLEVRHKHGNPYSLSTLDLLCCGILCYFVCELYITLHVDYIVG